jgi:hypothetical protein
MSQINHKVYIHFYLKTSKVQLSHYVPSPWINTNPITTIEDSDNEY